MRTWSIPPEPEDAEGVIDCEGHLWRRRNDDGRWFCCGAGSNNPDPWAMDHVAAVRSWSQLLLGFGPVRETTRGRYMRRRQPPIEITDDILLATYENHPFLSSLIAPDQLHDAVVAAFEAAGFMVKGREGLLPDEQ